MSGEQIVLIASLALLATVVLIVIAMLAKENAEGTLELPFGIKIRIRAAGKRRDSNEITAQDRKAIKEVIRQHNADFAAAISGRDMRVLEHTVTESGLAQVRRSVDVIRQSMASNSGLGAELVNVKWLDFEMINPDEIRVTTDEKWEWIYPGARMPATARNKYTLKRINTVWRIDHAEVFGV